VVEAVRASHPDVIAVTGDLVDDRAEDVAAYERALGGLSAPLGVYTIAGNHDIYAGWEAVEPRLRALAGSELLLNEARLLERDGEQLALLGTGDPAAGSWGRSSKAGPDIAQALSRVPDGVTTIAFAHNPALWPALARRGVALTLSGHTHWGQFALPGRGWSLASLFLPHAMGAHQDGDSLLYIHPGTGYWGIPFRLGAYPEVAIVTLRAAPTAGVRMGQARPVCRRAA
jgi:predicted MPP superfamily phosphohydrolase